MNLQGELPNLDPKLIKESLRPLTEANAEIATLGVVINDEEELQDPNVVKIALSLGQDNNSGRALYFSRTPIPYGSGSAYHHIGIYAYTRQTLQRFVQMPQSLLEKQERLEQLRALEANMHIGVQIVNSKPLGVDTENDLLKARDSLLGP